MIYLLHAPCSSLIAVAAKTESSAGLPFHLEMKIVVEASGRGLPIFWSLWCLTEVRSDSFRFHPFWWMCRKSNIFSAGGALKGLGRRGKLQNYEWWGKSKKIEQEGSCNIEEEEKEVICAGSSTDVPKESQMSLAGDMPLQSSGCWEQPPPPTHTYRPGKKIFFQFAGWHDIWGLIGPKHERLTPCLLWRASGKRRAGPKTGYVNHAVISIPFCFPNKMINPITLSQTYFPLS